MQLVHTSARIQRTYTRILPLVVKLGFDIFDKRIRRNINDESFDCFINPRASIKLYVAQWLLPNTYRLLLEIGAICWRSKINKLYV